MKRVVLVAAAAAATVIGCAVPVFADTDSNVGMVRNVSQAAENTVNPITHGLPTPKGWEQRHVCAWNDHVDQSWCVFFPFPI